MKIHKIEFTTIKEVWQNNLWQNRESAIEPCSSMTFMHDLHLDFSFLPQIFLGGYVGNTLVAVNSLHLAEKYLARSRGLWVDPTYRNNGYGKQILLETNRLARELNADAIWSFPRKNSISTYKNAGYIQTSSWLTHGEFGPNCYAICFLKNNL
jgi:GNAT superfamily N-acetyltransferase